MSGIKDVYVTITQSERNRLISTAKIACETAAQAQYRQQQTQKALNDANAKAAELSRVLNAEISGLNSEIKKMAQEQNRRLKCQADGFNRTIEEIKNQMEQDKLELQNAIKEVQESLDAKEQSHKQMAEFWLEQVSAFIDDIANYRHELFAPNQLNLLRSQLALIGQDMEGEAYQSAISSGRSLFERTANLKDIVVNAEVEWSHYYNELLKLLAQVKSDINYSNDMKFVIETENGDEEIDSQIDYWTEGGLKAIATVVQEIDERIQDAENISTEELVAMIAELKRNSEQIREVQCKAKEALIASQLRADMAGTMADALAGAGWECTGYTYEGDECNKPLHIKFEDGNGNEIVAIISPDKVNDTLANNLAINFFDPYNNDESMRGIWVDSIKSTLDEAGLNAGTPTCREGYEVKSSDNEQIRNIEETKRRG